jgi:anti-anti-sigma factor
VVTPPCPRSPWDGHLLLLHNGEDERLARTAAWVRRGLDLGERVVLADGPGGDRVLDALRRRRLDVETAARGGLLIGAPAEELVDPEVRRTLVAQALEAGYPGVRVEAPGSDRPRLAPGPEGERDAQELSWSGRVSVLCRFDRAHARGPLLRSAVASHPDGVRAGIFGCRLSHAGLTLSGEVDISVADVLAAALHAATAAAHGLAWVDVGELRFLDVAGARALVHVTRRFREDGGTLLLLDARPPVRHVLQLLGLDALEGLVVYGES